MDYLQIFISFIAILFSLYISYPKKHIYYIVWVLFFVMCFLSAAYIVADLFTGKGIDESVLYHRKSGISGADLKGNIYKIFTGSFITLIPIFTIFILKKYQKGCKYDLNRLFIVIGIFISLIVHPFFYNMYNVMYANSSMEIAQEDVSSDFKALGDYSQKDSIINLVYIYLEGFDNAYLDENTFPGLAPNLQKIVQNNTDFKNVRQLPGTGWTIAGMVSSQCGIPLLVGGNGLGGVNEFLPRAECIGDILKEKNYFLSYVGGADKTFSGKNIFYETHGFDEVLGKQDVELGEYKNSWGLYDDTMLDLFFDKYTQLAQGNVPFALYGLTLDTHGPHGFVSESCPLYINEEENILNSVHCTDFLISKLIANIQNSEYYDENTLIVLSSDHLQMGSQKNNKIDLDEFERTNLFVMLNETPQSIEVEMSTLDIAPVVLNELGFEINELGFGKNVLNGFESFVSKYYKQTDGEDDFYNARKVLFSYKPVISQYLDFPSLTRKILVDISNKKLILAKQEYNYPVLLFFDDNKQIYDVLFQKGNFYALSSYDKSGNYLWIDTCKNIDTQGEYLETQDCYIVNDQLEPTILDENTVIKIK